MHEWDKTYSEYISTSLCLGAVRSQFEHRFSTRMLFERNSDPPPSRITKKNGRANVQHSRIHLPNS